MTPRRTSKNFLEIENFGIKKSHCGQPQRDFFMHQIGAERAKRRDNLHEMKAFIKGNEYLFDRKIQRIPAKWANSPKKSPCNLWEAKVYWEA